MIPSFSSKFGLATMAGAVLLAGCASGGAVLRQAQDDIPAPSEAIVLGQTPGAAGLCTDTKGDVFVTQIYGHQIVEYKHGRTRAIKTLNDPGYEPGACSARRR